MAQKYTPHSDKKLGLAADYLEYHINMYTSTYALLIHPDTKQEKGTAVWNALLVAHLIHFRLIIVFLTEPIRTMPTDVIAADYFHDKPKTYIPSVDKYLADWRKKVNTRTAHLTTEPMTPAPLLISEQDWPVGDIAALFMPKLRNFLSVVPKKRFPKKHMESCIRHFEKLGFEPPDRK